MKTTVLEEPTSLDLWLATLLSYGSWLATSLIAIGVGSPMLGMPLPSWSAKLSAIGVAIIIVLPVLSVCVMAVAFVLERDPVFAAIACLVLGIIALSSLLGAAAV